MARTIRLNSGDAQLVALGRILSPSIFYFTFASTQVAKHRQRTFSFLFFFST
jgi:hypothetical protein